MSEAPTITQFLWLIPVAPLLGAAFNGLVGKTVEKRLGQWTVHGVACATVALSFVLSVTAFLTLVRMPEHERALHQVLFTWIQVGRMRIPLEYLFDPLSAVMCLVITGIGFLIHVYSIGYMHHDKGYARFFCYLNLFVFSMLTLVLGGNLLLLFVGWEGVGLCSYLLIGFWFEEKKNAIAGMKAFVVNRVGDLGFVIGAFALYWGLERVGVPSLTFGDMRGAVDKLGHLHLWGLALPSLVTFALFFAATGKSAQIPLYVWLPDAMAGPTPVSALIHAATMVTAGIYLICRMSFVYVLAPGTLAVVAGVACATALVAATIGMAQNDIKKVLAYSTVSQLGYMFLGCGVGAFSAGLFHVVTHAFFKALLFLGSGSVIHAMGGEQDIRKMGGLWKHLPITGKTFLIGTLAIAGVPGLAGFFSKDEILWKVFASGSVPLYAIALTTAGITAFYMMRLTALTFFGEFRGDHHTKEHLHESPPSMTVPLIVLAAGAVFVGWLGVPGYFPFPNFFHHWLEPSVASAAAEVSHHTGGHGSGGAEHSTSLEIALTIVSVLVGFAGMGLAWFFYRIRPEIPRAFVERFPVVHRWVENKYYVDELYQGTFVRGVLALSEALATFDQKVIDGMVNGVARLTVRISAVGGWIDQTIVDGFVNGLASVSKAFGRAMSRLQTGQIQSYLTVLVVAVGAAWLALEVVF